MKLDQKQYARRTKGTRKFLIVIIWVLLAAAFLVGGYYVFTHIQRDDKQLPVTQSASPSVVKQPPVVPAFAPLSETPTRLTIEKLGIDAPIESVGIIADGSMGTPNSLTGVGWYKQSAKAGESAYSVLLDGHYGTDDNPGVFYRLGEAVVGDKIIVEGDEGTKLTYEVAEIDKTPLENVDMTKALMPYKPGTQSLTMITCEGVYDPSRATYKDRTIVYAERIT